MISEVKEYFSQVFKNREVEKNFEIPLDLATFISKNRSDFELESENTSEEEFPSSSIMDYTLFHFAQNPTWTYLNTN